VYWSPAFILATASRQGTPALSYGYLRHHLGVSASTVRRWLSYFKQFFPATPQWMSRRGYIHADVRNDELPGALLQHFRSDQDTDSALVAMLRFLAA
jgi:hypothetical protein